jgi:hypothetical protein
MHIILIAILAVAIVALFEFAALRWGYDSRDGFRFSRDGFRFTRR